MCPAGAEGEVVSNIEPTHRTVSSLATHETMGGKVLLLLLLLLLLLVLLVSAWPRLLPVHHVRVLFNFNFVFDLVAPDEAL